MPWQAGAPHPDAAFDQRTTGERAADESIARFINHSTADGQGGENTTGVRHWKKWSRRHHLEALRPIEPFSSLVVKLREEQNVMRFILDLVEDRQVKPATAANYVGHVQGWHLRRTGVKLAGGVQLARVRELIKGMRRILYEPVRKVRRGCSPQQLRLGMDAVLDPAIPAHANMRAALALGLQGLLRGAELTRRSGRWNQSKDLSRGDVVTLTKDRLAVMILPAKSMHHLNGKTVPLLIGGGGEFIDAAAEMINLFAVDPSDPSAADSTPLFRNADGTAITEDQLRATVKLVMQAVGQNPAEFGAHSLRIGGATALFAAGATQLDIMTMGRWSSDCYRLYVRACYENTCKWTSKLGSTVVHDVAEDYALIDCF